MGCTIPTETTDEDRQRAKRWHALAWCDNEDCPNHEEPGHEALAFKERYGDQPTQIRYECRACGATFSLRKHTPLYGSRIPDETFYTAAKCLGEGNGIRETARITGLDKDTVLDITQRLGQHAERVLTHHLRDLHPNEVQLDELWSFLKKKNQNLDEVERLEDTLGDCWVWVAFDPTSKAVLGFVLGKRSKDNCQRLLKRVHEVLGEDALPLFTSDELSMYEDAIVQVFGKTVQPERQGDRGRFPKPRRVPCEGLVYATVHKEREDDEVVAVTRRVVHGEADQVDRILSESRVSQQVNTSFVERHNGQLRQGVGRLGRQVLTFSKDSTCFRSALAWSIGYDHYCRENRGLREECKNPDPGTGQQWVKRSPMMALDKTETIWSTEELLLYRAPSRAAECSFGASPR
jgi:IS1 family transposase